MKKEQSYILLLILFTFIAAFMAGCTSQTPEAAPPDLPKTAHAIKTPAPTSTDTIPPTVSTTGIPVSTEKEPVSVLSSSPEMSDFAEKGIALQYPDRFRMIDATPLEKMRSVAEPQGIDIITIFTATDSKDSIQITRQNVDTTIEDMYADKMAISQEIDVNGSATVMGMTFVKYEVEKQSLSDGTGIVKILAKNSENGTAVTYLLCKPGSIYNINFIYESLQRAENQASDRDAIMQNVHLV
jgi:hypothetical protein